VNFATMLSNDVVAFTVEHQADAATRIVDLTSGATRDVPFKVQSLIGVTVSPQRDRITGGNIVHGVEGSDVIDLASGRLLRHLPQGRGFLAFANGGHALVNYDYKARAWRWDLDTGKLLANGVLASAERQAYSPDGELLAMKVFGEPRILIYETATFKVVAERPIVSAGPGYYALAFTPDGSQLVVALLDGRIGVFAAR
jgi:hypothetical protein